MFLRSKLRAWIDVASRAETYLDGYELLRNEARAERISRWMKKLARRLQTWLFEEEEHKRRGRLGPKFYVWAPM